MEFFDFSFVDSDLICSKYTKSKGNDLIHYLAKNSKNNVIFETLKEYVNTYPHKIDIQNDRGWTPLMFACCNTNTTSTLDCVLFLIEKNCNINLQDNDGNSALMKACTCTKDTSNSECVELLINHGANIHLRNRCKSNALMIACTCLEGDLGSDEKCVEVLINHGAIIKEKEFVGRIKLFFYGNPKLYSLYKNRRYEDMFNKMTELIKISKCFI